MPSSIASGGESSPASEGKAPRTARGERTLRKILDAALEEIGEKGFSEGSIVGITSRARVALGTFYTYFDSKEAVFQELVRDMSAQVRDHVAPALSDSFAPVSTPASSTPTSATPSARRSAASSWSSR